MIGAGSWVDRMRDRSVVARIGLATASLALSAMVGFLILVGFGQLTRHFGGRVPSLAWANVGGVLFFVVALLVAAVNAALIARMLGRRLPPWGHLVVPVAVWGFIGITAFQPPAALDLKPFKLEVHTQPSTDFTQPAPASRLLNALATVYRPRLFFDSHDQLRPLDIEEFLAERDSTGVARHRACTQLSRVPDSCEELSEVRALYPLIRGHQLSYLDLDDDRWLRRDDPLTAHRIYYHVVEERGVLHFDYWWFFRYNRSPVRGALFCLPGLSYANVSCFDHEGDWEGVTVTVRRGIRVPESVRYAGHGWPGYRYEWRDLDRVGSTTGLHAHVYVAEGSHASYPVACRGNPRKTFGGCDQRDFKTEILGRQRAVPDGRHDGRDAWKYNDDQRCISSNCVQPIPVTRFDTPAEWNAYDGLWGRATCSAVAVVCLRVKGPPSPSGQERYQEPAGGIRGSQSSLASQ